MGNATIEKEWKSLKGLKCQVLWVNDSHYCGYVGIPKGNPAFELGYDDVPVSIHGGLTFGEHKLNGNTSTLWWLGFDCAHAGDVVRGSFERPGDHRWTLQEVIKETRYLAEQLERLTWKDIIKQKLEYQPIWFRERVKII